MTSEHMPPTKPLSTKLAWSLVLVLLGTSLGMAGSPWFETQVRSRLLGLKPSAEYSTTANMAQLKAMEARVTALAQKPEVALRTDFAARLAALESKLRVGHTGDSDLASDQDPMNDRLGQLEIRTRTVETAVRDAMAAAAQLNSFELRLTTLQSALADQAARLRAYANLIPLRHAINTGQAMDVYLDAIAAALPPGSGDIAALRRQSAQPITRAALLAQFDRTRAGLTQQQTPHPSNSWLNTALIQARTLVSPQARIPSSAALATARNAVAAGDIATAQNALKQASATEQQALSTWRRDAQRYLDTQAALTRLELRLAQQPAPSVLPSMTMAPAPVISPTEPSIPSH